MSSEFTNPNNASCCSSTVPFDLFWTNYDGKFRLLNPSKNEPYSPYDVSSDNSFSSKTISTNPSYDNLTKLSSQEESPNKEINSFIQDDQDADTISSLCNCSCKYNDFNDSTDALNLLSNNISTTTCQICTNSSKEVPNNANHNNLNNTTNIGNIASNASISVASTPSRLATPSNSTTSSQESQYKLNFIADVIAKLEESCNTPNNISSLTAAPNNPVTNNTIPTTASTNSTTSLINHEENEDIVVSSVNTSMDNNYNSNIDSTNSTHMSTSSTPNRIISMASTPRISSPSPMNLCSPAIRPISATQTPFPFSKAVRVPTATPTVLSYSNLPPAFNDNSNNLNYPPPISSIVNSSIPLPSVTSYASALQNSNSIPNVPSIYSSFNNYRPPPTPPTNNNPYNSIFNAANVYNNIYNNSNNLLNNNNTNNSSSILNNSNLAPNVVVHSVQTVQSPVPIGIKQERNITASNDSSSNFKQRKSAPNLTKNAVISTNNNTNNIMKTVLIDRIAVKTKKQASKKLTVTSVTPNNNANRNQIDNNENKSNNKSNQAIVSKSEVTKPEPAPLTSYSKRFNWSTELHKEFIRAYDSLSEEGYPTPKLIMMRMERNGAGPLMKGLTRIHVNTHLQKYELSLTKDPMRQSKFYSFRTKNANASVKTVKSSNANNKKIVTITNITEVPQQNEIKPDCYVYSTSFSTPSTPTSSSSASTQVSSLTTANTKQKQASSPPEPTDSPIIVKPEITKSNQFTSVKEKSPN